MNPTNISDRAVAWPGASAVPKHKTTSDAEGTIRLIFVEDDDDFREAAAAELVDLGFAVESFADGASMLAALANGLAADLIVLDWSLPEMSGIDLLPRLRREGINLPVVLLTGRSSCSSELHGEHSAANVVPIRAQRSSFGAERRRRTRRPHRGPSKKASVISPT